MSPPVSRMSGSYQGRRLLGKESLGNGNLSLFSMPSNFNTQRSDKFPSREASLHQAKSTDLCLFDGRLDLESNFLLPVQF